jgi:hypothetical protein
MIEKVLNENSSMASFQRTIPFINRCISPQILSYYYTINMIYP